MVNASLHELQLGARRKGGEEKDLNVLFWFANAKGEFLSGCGNRERIEMGNIIT